MFFSGVQISPSSVGLKSPSGGGEIQPIRGEKMTNEYDADSELPYTRESHGTRNRRAVNTRWGATEYAGGSRSLQVHDFFLIYSYLQRHFVLLAGCQYDGSLVRIGLKRVSGSHQRIMRLSVAY